MTALNPEYQELKSAESKEKTEKYREQQILNPEIEKTVLGKIQKGEKYSDLIFCPKTKCGSTLKIEEADDLVVLRCAMCGWERRLSRLNNE